MQHKLLKFGLVIWLAACCSCTRTNKKAGSYVLYKGLYSYGPEVKSFKDCDDAQEYWVADSSAQLELKYSQMNFEKPYEPVYVEVEGTKVASVTDGAGSEYDSTLVVKKVLKITKEIPQELCN